MSGWSRREVLAALATTGAAPGWLGLLSSCGATGGSATRTAGAATRSPEAVHDQLRRMVATLARHYPSVSGRAEIRRDTRVLVDAGERGQTTGRRQGVAITVFDGVSWFERATDDLSEAGITALAAGFTAGARRSSAPPRLADPARAGRVPRMKIDPREAPATQWLERAGRLYERARALGGSRIVYRAAALEVIDRDVLHVGDGHDSAERQVWTRADVLFLAWTGSAIAAEEATRAAAGGLETSDVSDDDLRRAADGALTHLSDQPIPAGEHDLLLDPSVTALFLRHGVARGLTGDAWAVGAARAASLRETPPGTQLTLRDDPTVAGAYGGYQVDDEGWPAAPISLITKGAISGQLTDSASAAALRAPRSGHGRRAAPLAEARPAPAHLVLDGGGASIDQLVAEVKDGFLLEGGAAGAGDARTWTVALRARRAREITAGRLTGRVFGPAQVIGEVWAMLSAVRGLSDRTAVTTWTGDGELPASAAAPHIVTRAWIGGAR